jgi:hypothetical protein
MVLVVFAGSAPSFRKLVLRSEVLWLGSVGGESDASETRAGEPMA